MKSQLSVMKVVRFWDHRCLYFLNSVDFFGIADEVKEHTCRPIGRETQSGRSKLKTQKQSLRLKSSASCTSLPG